MSFSPDGKSLTSGAWDNTIKLWDVISGELLYRQTLGGHVQVVDSVAFSPADNELLASHSADGTIKLWDITSGKEQHTLHLSEPIYSLSFSPGGNLLTFSMGGRIVVQKISSNKAQHSTMVYSGLVCVVIFFPDGRLLASGDLNGKIKLWDVTSGRPLLCQTFSTDLSVNVIFFRPDGKTIASNCKRSHTIQLWNIDSKEELQQLSTEYSRLLNVIEFSPEGRLLASASVYNADKLHATISGEIQPQQTVAEQRVDVVLSVAFSLNCKLLAEGTESGKVKIWSLTTGQLWRSLSGIRDQVISIAFSPNNKLLVAVLYDMYGRDGIGKVVIWDVDLGIVLQTLRKRMPVGLIACSSNGELLAYRKGLYSIEFLDTYSGQLKGCVQVPRLVNKLYFHDELPILQTNLGSINIGDDTGSKFLGWTDLTKYEMQEDWILDRGQKLLWLPPEYRGVFAYQDDLIALGLRSGRTVLFEFSLKDLDLGIEDDEDDEVLTRKKK